jgi:alcohol dehydrogenase
MGNQKLVDVHVPVRILSGIGSHRKTAEKIKELGKTRVLVVTDRGVVKAGKLEMLTTNLKSAKIDYLVFDEVLPDPPIANVEKAVDIARKEKVDLLIGMGGGSSIDVAKAVRIVAPNGGSVKDWVGARLEYPVPFLELISIPTTAGTGSEASSSSVITDVEKRTKLVLKSPKIFSTLAILDSEMLAGIPAEIAAHTGLDAISHAVENYVSRNRTFVTQALSLWAIRILFKNFPRFVANTQDLEAGQEMLQGSCIAGFAMTTGGLGLVHAMSHPIGTYCKVSHGLACGVCLPHVVEYNIPADPEGYAEIALSINPHHAADYRGSAKLAHKVVDEIKAIMTDINVPRRISEAGHKLDISEPIIEETLASFMSQVNPRTVTREKVIDILNKIK